MMKKRWENLRITGLTQDNTVQKEVFT